MRTSKIQSILKLKTHSFIENYKKNMFKDILHDESPSKKISTEMKEAIRFVFKYVDKKGFGQMNKSVIMASKKFNLRPNDITSWIQSEELGEKFFLDIIKDERIKHD